MKRASIFLVPVLILACGVISAADQTGDSDATDPPESLYDVIGSDSITPLLPSDTLVWFRVPSLDDMTRQVEQLPMMRMLNSDPMRPFRDLSLGRSEEILIDRFGLDMTSIRNSIAGEFVVAGFGGQNGQLSMTCFVQTASDDEAQALVDNTSALMLKRGAREQVATIDDSVQLQLVEPNERLVLTKLGRHAMFSGDVKVAGRIKQRWQTTGINETDRLKDRLIDQDRFREPMTALEGPQVSLLHWYFDPIALAVVGDEATPSPDAELYKVDGEVRPFAMRHGLSGFQAVTGRAWINLKTGNLETRSILYAPEPRENALAMFDFEPGSLTVPDFVTDDVNNVTIVRWNLATMINHAESIYDDATDAPGAFRGTMEDLKSELNVDLIDGLFTKIGPEIVICNLDDPKLDIESTVISIEIQDPPKNEQAVATMIYNLLIGDTEARRFRLPGKRYELWQIKFVVDEETMPFSKAGLIVADGRLWISTHAATLQRFILNRNKSPLVETPVYQSMRSIIGEDTHEETFGVSMARMDRDARVTYEVLRAEGLKGLQNVESIYATLIRSIFQTDGEEAGHESIDFSKLPPFDEIRDYLNNLSFVSQNNPIGWEIFGVAFEDTKERQDDEKPNLSPR